MPTLTVLPGTRTGEVVTFTLLECCKCGVPFMIAVSLNNTLKEAPGTTFYCPHGHAQHYTGKSTEDKLREQLERERLEHQQEQDAILEEYNRALKEKRSAERKLSRVYKGTCPECKRSFNNLKRHMDSCHHHHSKKNSTNPEKGG